MKIIADANIPAVEACFSSVGEVTTLPQDQITAEAVKDADALLVRSYTKVNADLLAESNLSFAATSTIGVDHIDQAYLKKRGIAFSAAPGSNANSVAEYVIAALLRASRKHNLSLEGKSLGIVGAGNVGSNLADKAGALGLTVKRNDPPLQRASGDQKFRPLEELFDCDFISLHVPLTREGPDRTYHLADETFFSKLKPGAFLINSSRGSVHDTKAVLKALVSGRLAGALLDVWENEPDIDLDLLGVAEIATPHIAGYSFDGKVAGMFMLYQAFCSHFGIQPTASMSTFLPPPEVPEIVLEECGDRVEDQLWKAVEQVYPIDRDIERLKELLTLPAKERGTAFKRLRKEYPRRREFQNTKITLRGQAGDLKSKFQQLGFKIT